MLVDFSRSGSRREDDYVSIAGYHANSDHCPSQSTQRCSYTISRRMKLSLSLKQTRSLIIRSKRAFNQSGDRINCSLKICPALPCAPRIVSAALTTLSSRVLM